MRLSNVHLVYFSPTGTSKRVVELLCNAVDSREVSYLDLTHTSDYEPVTIAASELVMIAVPVYAGRVPTTAVERLRHIKGNGGPVVLVVLYGNREFEDALIELRDLAVGAGFRPLAGCAFIGEHSFSHEESPIAAGRPDQQDADMAVDFGARILAKLDSLEDLAGLHDLEVPGNFPYQQGMGNIPFTPKVETDLCTQCGACVEACPTGAAQMEAEVLMDPEKCIYCCACRKSCPEKAIKDQAPPILEKRQWLFENCMVRKEPQLFI